MYDRYGRPHYEQIFRNTSASRLGDYADTIEVCLGEPITDIGIKTVKAEILDFLDTPPVWFVFPGDDRITVAVPAGYYDLNALRHRLDVIGFHTAQIRGFYSARLAAGSKDVV